MYKFALRKQQLVEGNRYQQRFNTGAVNYQYRSDNKLRSVTLPDENTLYFNYDENGRLFQIQYPGTNVKKTILYQGNGWCTQIQDSQFPDKNYYNIVIMPMGVSPKVTSWAGVHEYMTILTD
ncbi:hypothetical protein [Desulfosporosinus sp. BG]|uniref:hypothetical protein n=1 Tax=Desulfosporosinus sp. BG TaxID=1633135 RepID=UPI000839EC60|nr:hypothetical protein [Desulfosporosinus sp. BG]